MKKIIITIVVSVLTIIFLLGFIDRSATEVVKSTADITYSIDGIPKDLKAVSSLTKREQDIICATSRGLIQIDKDGNIVPSLAESVDITQDGIQYDFKIRDDVYWSDGTKITPKDIVMFFREVITVEDENNISAFLEIFGARGYKDSNLSFSEQVAISSTDTSVIIRLNSANPDFLYELSNPQYRVRKNVLLWENIEQNYSSIPYSGDYTITEINDDQIVLTRSNKANVQLAKTIHIVKDNGEDLALAAFEVGNRDIVVNPPRSQLERLNSEGKLLSLPSNKATYLVFNPNSDSIPASGRKEIYKDFTTALQEYQLSNKSSIELAEGSYFRNDSTDLSKLQARKVMSNSDEQWEKPDEIVLIAEETLQNKDLVDFLYNWFDKNTDINLSCTLVKSEDMKNIKDKTYYNVALVDVDASLGNKLDLYNSISDFLPTTLTEKLKTQGTDAEIEQVYSEVEDSIFNTYSVLPLIFYNDNIAINSNIQNISLDGNGNLTFEMIKK